MSHCHHVSINQLTSQYDKVGNMGPTNIKRFIESLEQSNFNLH